MLDAGYGLDAGRRKARIAVIDDDVVFVDVMHDLLAESEGYEVVSNSQWVEGYEFIKTMQPDLVILDLMMGRLESGWIILKLLRDDPRTVDIPVILCSAAESALRPHSPALEGNALVEAVAKPFDIDHLLTVITRLLKQCSRVSSAPRRA